MRIIRLLGYQDSALFDRYIRSVTENPVKGEEEVYRIREDKYLHIHISKSPDGYQGILTDVTRDILLKKQMQYENAHDPLTGLYKFEYFKQLSAETLSSMPSGKTAAIAMFDLDHFKSINDSFGHDAGDRYLQCFAAVMKSMLGGHVISARRSGDEFCMLIFNCDGKEQVIQNLDLLYETLRKSQVALSDTQSKAISAFCGFTLADHAGNDIGELLGHADEALYEVKRSTKGRYAEYAGQ